MTYRHLKAHLKTRSADLLAVLRFPPGVTLEDAGYDWTSLHVPALPPETVERLRNLGVEIVATGREAMFKAHNRARVKCAHASLDDFAEDYLDVNARLGGERCVSVAEYAMHTKVGRNDLGHALRRLLLRREDVRVYGDTAFRAQNLPRLLRLRLANIVCHELPSATDAYVPCLLHGNECRNYPGYHYRPDWTVFHNVCHQQLDSRVTVPHQLLDDLADGTSHHLVARATRAVARLVLDALPDDAWMDDPHGRLNTLGDIIILIASATAETCEEYSMLINTLKKCSSAREVVQKSCDIGWVAARTLEA